MYISAIINPNILDAQLFHDNSSHYDDILDFLKDIYERGVLIYDNCDDLGKAIRIRLEKMPPKYSKRLEIFLEEISNANKRVLLPVEHGAGYGVRLVKKYVPDTFLSCAQHDDLRYISPHDYKTVLNLEITKKIITPSGLRYASTPLILKEGLDEEIIRDAIGRCVKFSPRITINDKQIGNLNKEGPANIDGFYRGIKYITSIWEECCVLRREKTLEINTTYGKGIESLNPFEVKKRLNNALVARLAEDFPHISFSLTLHDDSKREYHYRTLVSSYAKVQFDYGFDLFRGVGKPGCKSYLLKTNPITRHTVDDPDYFRSNTKIQFAENKHY